MNAFASSPVRRASIIVAAVSADSENLDPPVDRVENLVRISRRSLLGAICGLSAVELSASRCSRHESLKPGQVAIPIRDLAPGRRVIVIAAGNPVEVVRSEQGIVARSLRCTHWGCVVKWKQEESAYVCPCHEGRYDATGAVLAGPPPLPLRSVPVKVSNGEVVVGDGNFPA